MDPVKSYIASEVQAAVLMVAARGIPDVSTPERPSTASKISALETQVRVPTAFGSRYFTVKVSENL